MSDYTQIATSSPRAFNPTEFQPSTQLSNSGNPLYVTDLSTDRKYANRTPEQIKALFNSAQLSTQQTFFVILIGSTYRALKIATLAHFWLPRTGEGYQLGKRISQLFQDIVRVTLFLPLVAVAPLVLTVLSWHGAYTGSFTSVRRFEKAERLLCGIPYIAAHFFHSTESFSMGPITVKGPKPA